LRYCMNEKFPFIWPQPQMLLFQLFSENHGFDYSRWRSQLLINSYKEGRRKQVDAERKETSREE
ncbi:hypothetical protein CHS0354_022335, partial [Potamilus streckersoni]